jgi:hypothetical protein
MRDEGMETRERGREGGKEKWAEKGEGARQKRRWEGFQFDRKTEE